MANARILVVDDEKGVVRSCVRILEREGYTVTGKTESVSVPALLKQETFDLLLSDIKMPKLDGLELLKITKEIDPHISVVLITGYGTMEDTIQAIRLGAQGFLMKPFEPEELVTTINDNLSRRTLVRDSLRLQTLLPFLEINQILQVSGGEISLVRRVLEIAQKSIGAARLAWLRYQPAPDDYQQNQSQRPNLVETVVLPNNPLPSHLPPGALESAASTGQPVWVRADGSLIADRTAHPNIVGALLPLLIKGKVAGILTAETGNDEQSGPFGAISLELLSVLAGQLTIIIENVQLFQQTEKLRTFNEDIIQNMTNGLIAIDNSKQITAFNPAASTMLGCNVDQTLGQTVNQAMQNVPDLAEILDQTLATGRSLPHQEITIEHQDGRRLPVAVSTSLLGGQTGRAETEGVVAVLEDLSDIKALEAERRRLDRLAALGQMAAVVAHEIRNPVAGIAAGVEYLTRKAAKGSPEYEGSLMIQGEVERVNRILEDILFVARPLKLNLAAHSLDGIIENVVKRCQPQINESQVIVSVESDNKLPRLDLDAQRLEQVFTNLITNATQAMATGGHLLLQSKLNAASNAEEIVVTVTDDGPGMPAEVRQRIFEPFFTTKTRGTGLGLSVARRIIEEHGGTITVESRLSQGTQFIIKLPVKRRTAR